MSNRQIHLGYNTAAPVIVAVVIINEAGFGVLCYGQLRVLVNLNAQSKARALFLWLREVFGYRCEASAPVGHIMGPEWGWPLTFASCLQETGAWWSLTEPICVFPQWMFMRGRRSWYLAEVSWANVRETVFQVLCWRSIWKREMTFRFRKTY